MWEKPGILRGKRRLVWAAFAAAGLFWFFFLRLPRPPEPGIVALYRGGKVTKGELRRYLHEYLPRCPRHRRCPRHGEDHSGCTVEEECETFVGCGGEHGPAENLGVYRQAAISLVVDRLIGDEVARKRLAERKKARHLMKHVTEEINLADLARDLREQKIRVEAAEIDRYYEENREKFGERSIREVSDRIEQILRGKKEKLFLEDYLKTLREDSALAVNYELLRYPEPTADQVRARYFEKRDELREPAGAGITIVRSGEARDNDEVRKALGRAGSLLLSGAAPGELRERLGPESLEVIEDLAVSEADELWSAADLGARFPGEVTDVVASGNRLLVARVEERETGRPLRFEEAEGRLSEELREELRGGYLAENRNATLFTIHGEPYTLGEFMEEFEELPPFAQERYAGYKGREELADLMIERSLLLEAASDEARDIKNREAVERVRRLVLKQLLHQEEVDDKISLTDGELREFFEKNRRYYRRPARVRVSVIRSSAGDATEDALRRAREKADSALAELKAVESLDDPQFAQVARRYSDDPDVVKTGGKVTEWIGETDDLVSELFYHPFHENIMALRKGELSPVFRMGDGFYVVWVRDREEEKEPSFEEARELVRRDLREVRHHEATAKLESDLVRKAKARIYDYTLLEMLREEARAAKRG